LRQLIGNLTGTSLMERQGPGDAVYFADALIRSGYGPNRQTDYISAAIAAEQYEDGGWHGSAGARTPLEDGDFSRTAMAMRVLKAYGPPARSEETRKRLERAKRWLLETNPVITEDWDMRLAGIAAAGASSAELRKAAQPILSRQRPDGGWAQRDELAS